MSISHWLGLPITITLDNKTERGYLSTPKNQSGNFYLHNRKDSNLLLTGKASDVTRVSLAHPILQDAWAFCTDPDAREVSIFKHPSGRPMSIREAKQKGLIP